MAYLFLLGAIIFEVAGTVSLRLAVDNKRWYGAVVVGYIVAFVMLTLTLSKGTPRCCLRHLGGSRRRADRDYWQGPLQGTVHLAHGTGYYSDHWRRDADRAWRSPLGQTRRGPCQLETTP